MTAMAHDDDRDRGATSVAPGSERHCALSHQVKPVGEMIRFVIGPDGEAVPDIKRKLPGRGIWITATYAAVEEAVRRNVFARGFKRGVKAEAGLAPATGRMLERAALDALAMAGKSGAAVCGFDAVEGAMGGGRMRALIHAADGAEDGKRKLDAALQRKNRDLQQEIPIIDAFTGVQLDLALNRSNVVHAALLAGPASETFIARSVRLMRFRTGQTADPAVTTAPTTTAPHAMAREE